MSPRIADASDIPVWGWQVWGVVGLAFIVAVAVVLYLDATHPFPTPRDAAPAPVPSTTEPVRAREVPPALRVHLCAECGLRPVDRPGMVCAPYCVHPSHEAEQIIRDAGGVA